MKAAATYLTRSDTWAINAEIDDASGILFETFSADSSSALVLFMGAEFAGFSAVTFNSKIGAKKERNFNSKRNLSPLNSKGPTY